ncbi:MAG TPA: amidohydrolase family protein [Bryobacterales bacterium]|nr:amidohydrolase family protein [Bryobacterales bacterium]
MSEDQKRRLNFRFFLRLLHLSENGRMDQDYLDFLVAQLRNSSVEKAVLLAQDSRYDAQGRPDYEHTSFYVPNEYLFDVCKRFPRLFIPCVSINPKRRDAIDELDRCAERGARVLKIHPPIQNVDPGEDRFRPFYRRCAETGIIVMVHTGMEHAAETVGDSYSNPTRLAAALEEGCTVVAAHTGTAAFFDKESFFPHMISMLDRFPRLYYDTSIMASMFRWRTLPRLLEMPQVLARAIHASDYPFPSNAVVHWNRLSSATTLALASERNLLERDYRLKKAIGLPKEVFERGAKLLRL